MKTLHLTLKKKWFDMILSGKKKEEYREIKQYWNKRITGSYIYDIITREKVSDSSCYSVISQNADILRNDWLPKQFDRIVFRKGYSKDTITVECLGIEYGRGKTEWGAEKDKFYFVIKLGEIIDKPKEL